MEVFGWIWIIVDFGWIFVVFGWSSEVFGVSSNRRDSDSLTLCASSGLPQ